MMVLEFRLRADIIIDGMYRPVYNFLQGVFSMRTKLNITEGIFPMPVLMIATYNDDGSVNVMNAAWGTMQERDRVALNLTETHKTVQNIINYLPRKSVRNFMRLSSSFQGLAGNSASRAAEYAASNAARLLLLSALA